MLRDTGYAHAHAFALAAVCHAAPDLQVRFALLAFGTAVPGELGPRVLCARMSDFLLKGGPALKAARTEAPKRVVSALPLYGGFEPRYAFLGMAFE
jgi:hypothetical protein